MATGIVSTARGQALNLDELIMKGQRPIGTVDAHSTRQTPNYVPEPANKPHLRGFSPVMGEATPPAVTDTVPSPTAIPASFSKDGSASSLNDITGVKIRKTKTPKVDKQTAAPTAVSDDDELGDLVDKLKVGTKAK